MGRSHPFVTPEGVAVGLEPAGLGSRAVALAIDLVIEGAVIGLALVGNALLDGGTAGIVIALLTAVAVVFGYPIAFEVAQRGQTPGKRLAGVRVQSIAGAPPTLSQSVVRSAMSLVDLWVTLGSVAVISHLVTARGQRLGDLAAGTVVVGEPRAREVAAHEFVTPPHLLELAERLDPSGLRPADYRAVRQFLLRAPTLPDETRADLAARLADGVARRLAQPVPPEVDPHDYLSAVAAVVQARARR